MELVEQSSFGIIVSRLAELQLAQLPPKSTEPIHRALAELAMGAKACALPAPSEVPPRLQLDSEGYRLHCEVDVAAQTVIALSITPLPKQEAPLRLLLVDDDRFLLTLLGEQLRELGHEVVSVESVDEALRHPLERFDGIVCDFVMPGMSGHDLLRRLREERGATTPFVFITSSGKTEWLVRQAIRYDADLLQKPVDCDRLLALFRERRAEREALGRTSLAG